MTNYDKLIAEKVLQPHHMRAMFWYAELPADHPAHKQIAEQCHSVARWTPTLNVSPHKLLREWCIERRPFPEKEIVRGLLREALNVCDRAMRHERYRG